MATAALTRKRYRGRTRAAMQSARRHLNNLIAQHLKAATACSFIEDPAEALTISPSGLLDTNSAQLMGAMVIQLSNLLKLKGVTPTCNSVL